MAFSSGSGTGGGGRRDGPEHWLLRNPAMSQSWGCRRQGADSPARGAHERSRSASAPTCRGRWSGPSREAPAAPVQPLRTTSLPAAPLLAAHVTKAAVLPARKDAGARAAGARGSAVFLRTWSCPAASSGDPKQHRRKKSSIIADTFFAVELSKVEQSAGRAAPHGSESLPMARVRSTSLRRSSSATSNRQANFPLLTATQSSASMATTISRQNSQTACKTFDGADFDQLLRVCSGNAEVNCEEERHQVLQMFGCAPTAPLCRSASFDCGGAYDWRMKKTGLAFTDAAHLVEEEEVKVLDRAMSEGSSGRWGSDWGSGRLFSESGSQKNLCDRGSGRDLTGEDGLGV